MEYLYFPLGGNKKGRFRTYINLMLVMLLGGLWHGAAWSYAIWGGVHGLALVIERFFNDFLKIKSNTFIKTLKVFFVFSFVTLAWLLFKLPNFQHVIDFFKSIHFNLRKDDNYSIITYIFLYSSPVFLYHIFYLLKTYSSFEKIKNIEYFFYGLMLFFIIVNSGTSGDFIYFQF